MRGGFSMKGTGGAAHHAPDYRLTQGDGASHVWRPLILAKHFWCPRFEKGETWGLTCGQKMRTGCLGDIPVRKPR